MHVLTCKEHGRKASEETLLRWVRRMVKVLVMALDSDDGGRAMVIMMMMKMMVMVIME